MQLKILQEVITLVVFIAFSVIAFDSTGTYSSEGRSRRGTCQPLLDLIALLDYIKAELAKDESYTDKIEELKKQLKNIDKKLPAFA